MNSFIDVIRRGFRAVIRFIAPILNKLSGGKLTPAMVTITGLLAHIPIAWLIATTHHNILAAGLLLFFGLFDALDGELARIQKRSSNAGMLLDATTDRMKEVILYIGIAASVMNSAPLSESADKIISTQVFWGLLAIVAACGGSLLVSYVKAKGETAVAGGRLSANEVNRLFQDGLMRYEVRMSLIFLGLLTNRLILAVIIIAFTAWLTAIDRLIKISRSLNNAQN